MTEDDVSDDTNGNFKHAACSTSHGLLLSSQNIKYFLEQNSPFQ